MPNHRRSTRPNILWVADPWDRLNHRIDTTVRLLHESLQRGNNNYWCSYHDIGWSRTRPILICQRVILSDSTPERAIVFDAPSAVKSLDFDFVILRADPPIGRGYWDAIQMLIAFCEQLRRDPEKVLINPPSVLLNHDGKLLGLRLGQDAPRTVVSNDVRKLCEFVESEGMVVLKPLHRHDGSGIRLVSEEMGKRKLSAITKKMTHDGSTCILAQQYLRRYHESEKRVWFVDGKVIAACRKRFQLGQFPPPLMKDNYIEAGTLSQTERGACTRLGRALRELRIRLAGVDLIDGFVTDVNIVSPGLLTEMEHVNGKNLASRVMIAIERLPFDPNRKRRR